jgi:hypothetical protein
MRIVAACFIVLAFSRAGFASNIQPNDHVFAVEEGIACADWSSFEKFRDIDPRRLTVKLSADCLIIRAPPPVRLFVETVREETSSICARPHGHSRCLWFPIGKVQTQLSADQRRI